MAKKTIQGHIIRIIDTRTVIINLGRNDGITSESIFNILGEPEEIYDPISNSVLGSVNVVKSKVKTSQAYEKFTIATTNWTTQTFRIPNQIANSLSQLFETTEIDKGELLVDKNDLQPWKAKSEILVKVGDKATVEIEDDRSTDKSNEEDSLPNQQIKQTP